MIAEPAAENGYLAAHAELLLASFCRRTGRNLLDTVGSSRSAAYRLYTAPFAVLSHDAGADPEFTYANLVAQACFEMPWNEIVGMPSRLSAEPLVRRERALLLERVAEKGYVDDYRGIRVARSGRRFLIVNAAVWNLDDAAGRYLGQAAAFSEFRDVAESGSL